MSVQVSSAHRDLGVIFTAGASRNNSLAKSRMDKARKRIGKIIRVASVSRAARKLFVSGALPQVCGATRCLASHPITFLPSVAWLPVPQAFHSIVSVASRPP